LGAGGALALAAIAGVGMAAVGNLAAADAGGRPSVAV
jgi:hypothetical protein